VTKGRKRRKKGEGRKKDEGRKEGEGRREGEGRKEGRKEEGRTLYIYVSMYRHRKVHRLGKEEEEEE
jgi:hypothetical protein